MNMGGAGLEPLVWGLYWGHAWSLLLILPIHPLSLQWVSGCPNWRGLWLEVVLSPAVPSSASFLLGLNLLLFACTSPLQVACPLSPGRGRGGVCLLASDMWHFPETFSAAMRSRQSCFFSGERAAVHSAWITRKEMLTHLFQTSRKFTFLRIFALADIPLKKWWPWWFMAKSWLRSKRIIRNSVHKKQVCVTGRHMFFCPPLSVYLCLSLPLSLCLCVSHNET